MKVLFLPFNIASMQAITSEALNKIEGVEARCINVNLNKYNTDNDFVIFLKKCSFRRSSPIISLIQYFRYKRQIKKWIKWADVLHYVWGPAVDNGWDVKLAMKLKKPIFVEWVGSDIRNPEILTRINKHYRSILNEGYEYRDIECGDFKNRVQLLFAKAGAMPTLMPEMSLFLNRKLFPTFIKYPHRINVEQYEPVYPDKNNNRPRIIHSPSVKIGKGSKVIEKTIDELKKEYDFEFILVHNMTREQALKTMRNADIFIDQIIVGGYGMAGCEAMAFGKPVVNYILPEVYSAGLPDDCPIINADPDNLKEQLIKLISDAVLRHETGKRSRLFIQRYSNVETIAGEFVGIYRKALQNNNS